MPPSGQEWTTAARLRADGRGVEVFEVAPGLHGLHAAGVGIGQQGMLVRTEVGNLLFDVPGLIDAESVRAVAALTTIRAPVRGVGVGGVRPPHLNRPAGG